jgi:hypothetical protein
MNENFIAERAHAMARKYSGGNSEQDAKAIVEEF